jgi:hypothetical protein
MSQMMKDEERYYRNWIKPLTVGYLYDRELMYDMDAGPLWPCIYIRGLSYPGDISKKHHLEM